jgi:hypothetical protein
MDTEQHITEWLVHYWGIRKEVKKFLEWKQNENTTYENLWDTAQAVLRRKFITINAFIETKEIPNKLPNAISQTPSKTRTN